MSTTVIICTTCVAFPQSSVFVQVLVITSVNPHPGTDVSLYPTLKPEQESPKPVGVPVPVGDVSSPHSIVTSGGAIIVGGVESIVNIV